MDSTSFLLGLAAGAIAGWIVRGGKRARLEDSTPPRAPVPTVKLAPDAALKDAELLRLVRAGEKIEAIKRYRALTGAQLKDSKDAVDALETSST